MIDFISKEEFLKAGLDFTDLFEESLFEYYLELDGLMYYDPKSKYMYDKQGESLLCWTGFHWCRKIEFFKTL